MVPIGINHKSNQLKTLGGSPPLILLYTETTKNKKTKKKQLDTRIKILLPSKRDLLIYMINKIATHTRPVIITYVQGLYVQMLIGN